jgi:hypothetical protein
LEIRRTEKEQVMFHNLYKGTSETPDYVTGKMEDENQRDDEIYSISAYKMEDLGPNHIMMADNRLLDEVFNM